MRILLIIFCLFSPIMAYRFLFAADVDCEYDNVFQYTASYWDGDKQISKNRTVTAFKNIFFYQEGATYRINNTKDVYADIEHNCTKSGEMDSFVIPFEEVRRDRAVQRFDYYVNLSEDD
ncbi:hypothetical protein GCK72_006749 [Caenorhabditis remanei]|uniref:Uncharacterized protein n=1 Tax=Caenorhabditis remanei TaxID=31234 RepID=A0A6A5HI52_CAERE|nr:hypothetical protein GCK72_006749 [Caenorhabditis remanei]KAF1766791.1 hypothetical protein GCK72_006749 [Caenorhabditis remanei]